MLIAFLFQAPVCGRSQGLAVFVVPSPGESSESIPTIGMRWASQVLNPSYALAAPRSLNSEIIGIDGTNEQVSASLDAFFRTLAVKSAEGAGQ